jgi:hypothetical protein
MAQIPVSVAGIQSALEGFRTDASDQAGRDFIALPTDVFIATYPKCGTTWAQQIVHSLRTGGDMNFDDINEVIPWLEMCLDLKQDPNDRQVAEPRAFKSHFHALEVPRGARYINVVREPKAVLVSFYRFFEGWYFQPGTVTIDEFAQEFFLSGSRSGRYWDHVVAWWQQRGREDTLLLDYESMTEDPAKAVRRIAAFLGFDSEPERIQVAIEQSSIQFMSQHKDKYDEQLLRRWRNPACGLPVDAGNSKVRSGKSASESGSISPSTVTALNQAWAETVTPAIDMADYAELRSAMRELT